MLAIAGKTVRLARAVGLRLRPKIAAWRPLGLNLLFPPRCARCECDLDQFHDGALLCASCRRELAPVHWVGCRRCGAATTGPGLGETCPQCRSSVFDFDTAVVLGRYHGALRDVVLRMKRKGGEPLAT